MAKKIFVLYISITFLFNLSHSFMFATYTVFLRERGMDLLEINLINTFFMLGIFIFEIPTGSFADKYGRKKSMVSGSFFYGAGMLIYYFSETFWFFVLAELIAAFGATLYSGASEAWAVDSLKFHKYDGCYRKLFKRESQFQQIAIIVGAVAGSILAKADIALPWLVSFIFNMGFMVFCWINVKEDYFDHDKSLSENSTLTLIAKDSLNFGIREKAVFFAIAFSAILMMCLQPLNMYWNLLFKEHYGLEVSSLGWIFAGISISIMAGSELSTRLSINVENEGKFMVSSQIITTLGILIAASMLQLPVVIFGFLFHELGRGIFAPIKKNYINHRIPSEKRATILSLDSMLCKGGAFVGLIASGYIAKHFSISLSWHISAFVLALCIPLFLAIRPKNLP